MRIGPVQGLGLAGVGLMLLAIMVFNPYSSPSVAVADDDASIIGATDSNYKEKVPTSVNDFYPAISETWGYYPSLKNEEQASKAVGFTLKFPRMDQDDYRLQLSATYHLENGNSYVWLFYSNNPIPDDMTINQFWEQGGITINYHENMTTVRNDVVGSMNYGEINPSFTNLTDMLIAVKDFGMDAYETDISGHEAIAIADVHREFQGYPIHDPAQVDFVAAGNTYVSLQGFKDTHKLIEIAESMPFSAEHEHH